MLELNFPKMPQQQWIFRHVHKRQSCISNLHQHKDRLESFNLTQTKTCVGRTPCQHHGYSGADPALWPPQGLTVCLIIITHTYILTAHNNLLWVKTDMGQTGKKVKPQQWHDAATRLYGFETYRSLWAPLHPFPLPLFSSLSLSRDSAFSKVSAATNLSLGSGRVRGRKNRWRR